ncbi:MAG: S-adenosylmethionine:tRNA ribosyltransferase-isomerase, partial [Opitutales bacterium]|nr:S-adenosylmethionine:tRNA ribosyltransferase-isomerase [Opitutales bacterium]
KPTGGNVECLLLAPLGGDKWSCMIKPAKRLPVGAEFGKDGVFSARVLEKFPDGSAVAQFDVFSGEGVISMSEKIGVVPLPPYIARDQRSPNYDRTFDNLRYETVYADPSKRVAAAAPTAGLHFTRELVETLEKRGHKFFDLTLHVGIGTFLPLKSDVVEEHKMHAEFYEIPAPTLRAMADANTPKLAVGTTSLRAMEDFARKHPDGFDAQTAAADSASLFVYPPQRVVSADAMSTNFHLPRSTLMCLVAAFLCPESRDGVEKLKELYRLAIAEKYNFYSYGDAMLIL